MQVLVLLVERRYRHIGIDQRAQHGGLFVGATSHFEQGIQCVAFQRTHAGQCRKYARQVGIGAGETHTNLLHGQPAALRVGRCQRPVFNNLAAAQHQHVGGVFIQFSEDVRGHHQRHAFVLEACEQRGERVARFRVEARSGFVEQQHLRRVYDRLADGDALTQPARQGGAALFQTIRQIQPRRGLHDRGGQFFFGHAVGAGRMGKALLHR